MQAKLYVIVNRLVRLPIAIIKILSFASVIFFSLSLFYAFYIAPDDYLQGAYVKIMYIHVPAAWFAMGCYTMMSLLSIAYIFYKIELYGIIIHALSKLGSLFAFITLVTGAIWGMPTWGTWWIWDARLTSMLILFFLYLGAIALYNSFQNTANGTLFTAYFILFGFINVPVIKFSVNLWNTLHQPASFFRLAGTAVHSSMIPPLVFMVISLFCITWAIISLLVESAYLEHKYQRCLMYY